jgi:hypothetical protein|uniref:Uncharacterized protein n=1 Tax=Fadolivirus 2 TaxID=2740747 RepID=A0A7D3QY14_9VIRU|nr:hypothetical protein Fadolivirus_2_14 [Fadolivirus 2]
MIKESLILINIIITISFLITLFIKYLCDDHSNDIYTGIIAYLIASICTYISLSLILPKNNDSLLDGRTGTTVTAMITTILNILLINFISTVFLLIFGIYYHGLIIAPLVLFFEVIIYVSLFIF